MSVPNFDKRSEELELMDQVIDSEKELFTNLKELEFINIFTGGRHTLPALKKLAAKAQKEVHIADIGYGAGDMLALISQHKNSFKHKINLYGIDLMPEAKKYIDHFHPDLNKVVKFITSDYRDYFRSTDQIDIAVAGLFCHHLMDEEIVEFFQLIQQHCKIGAIINDLHRTPLAYYSIKYLTQWFSKSRFTKNDAPLSVLRSFTKQELINLLEKAQIKKYKIEWKFAFRYVITIYCHE